MERQEQGAHQPVLLREALEGLALKPAGVYFDATFGRGGHSVAILKCLDAQGRLVVIDKDLTAIEYATQLFREEQRVQVVHRSFAHLGEIAADLNVHGKVDGILLDLGVSSPQLDEAERGFSFLQDGPLDMRMDQSTTLDAATWVNRASRDEIADVLKTYGEERFAKRIANAIVKARQEQPITRTLQFAEIVKAANPAWERHKHPATRAFQAVRIFINRELEALQAALTQCLEVLKVGGRLAVISFHSLEDRLVKHFILEQSRAGERYPRGLPVSQEFLRLRLQAIGKAAKPSSAEIEKNPRARSAVLRIAEKIA